MVRAEEGVVVRCHAVAGSILAGACVGGPPVPCDDGVFCNGVEGCEPTLGCQPGDAPEVNDGVDCTVDSCDAETDAPFHTPNDTLDKLSAESLQRVADVVLTMLPAVERAYVTERR